jgi:solute carrier family 25 iron transporter 28/37
VLFTPMEVLKARLQISRSGEEGKLLYQLRGIAKKEGFRGFYRGYVMGIASYLPFNVIWWTTYGNIRRNMSERSHVAQIACGAGAAAMASAAFIHPLELVKTRYQVATSDTVAAAGAVAGSRNSDQEGLRQVARNVMKENGVKGFYAGFLPTLLRSVPSSIIMMIVFEHLKAERKENAESVL